MIENIKETEKKKVDILQENSNVNEVIERKLSYANDNVVLIGKKI